MPALAIGIGIVLVGLALLFSSSSPQTDENKMINDALSRPSEDKDIDELQQELQLAMAEKNWVKASQLRDLILKKNCK